MPTSKEDTAGVKEMEETFLPDNCTVFQNELVHSDSSGSDSDSDDDLETTSPVADAFRGNTSKRKSRDSPPESTRNTRPKSTSGSRLPTKK